MIRQDYIKRLIERLGPVLQRLIGLRQTKKRDEAETVLRQACGELLGLDLRLILSMPLESLQQLFLLNEGEAAVKGRVAADLLAEYAEMLREQGSTKEAEVVREKAQGLRRWAASLPGGKDLPSS